ncbi:MAG: cytochrome family protein [Pedosphaera sp.]|nr:cytochrome family protein [Pedosphaera sp.]
MNDSPKSTAPSGQLTSRKRIVLFVVILTGLCVLALGAAYHYIRSGGMRARQTPSKLETFVARGLVEMSIPKETKALKNPLDASADGAAAAAGHELYQKNCEVCHGYDGSGKTAASSGLYPPPLDLRRYALAKRKRTDGELFYFIRSGIRNTAMPGWQLPDQQTWQLVAYIRNLPQTASTEPQAAIKQPGTSATPAHYVGSAACQECHGSLYERWRKTPMANVVRDPRVHPDAIIPDLSKNDPLVKFTANEIAFVYGSKWKQRYFKKIDDDYYVLPAQWDVTHKKWRPYFVKDDWWAPLYPPDNFKRPTSALCDGCHSVNYDIKTKTVTEWNVGCEKCHGPGSEHVKHPASTNIVNSARQGYVPANDVCIQCHSQGRPLENPIAGKYYDWPVGYDVTLKLSDHWKLEEHKLGETTFTHFADGTAHKNRMQGNDYVTSLMYTHGVACYTCHDAHGTENSGSLRKPAQALCLDCHGPNSPNGPHAPTLEQHTHHKPDSAGSECIACHMPKIAQTIADVNVRSHTFHFVSPATTESSQIPNACNTCHSDKSTAWATAALKSWAERSPWRVSR